MNESTELITFVSLLLNMIEVSSFHIFSLVLVNTLSKAVLCYQNNGPYQCFSAPEELNFRDCCNVPKLLPQLDLNDTLTLENCVSFSYFDAKIVYTSFCLT